MWHEWLIWDTLRLAHAWYVFCTLNRQGTKLPALAGPARPSQSGRADTRCAWVSRRADTTASPSLGRGVHEPTAGHTNHPCLCQLNRLHFWISNQIHNPLMLLTDYKEHWKTIENQIHHYKFKILVFFHFFHKWLSATYSNCAMSCLRHSFQLVIQSYNFLVMLSNRISYIEAFTSKTDEIHPFTFNFPISHWIFWYLLFENNYVLP